MQNLYVFGLNYRTADLSKREDFAFNDNDAKITLSKLINARAIKDGLILSTCNRSEIYFIADDGNFVVNNICAIKNICPQSILKYTYTKSNDDAVRHLFNVCSGLDSMILGETEIIAQIKNSILISTEIGAMNGNLSGIFQIALSVSKEVRNVTQINSIAISLGNGILSIVNKFIVSYGFLDKIAFIGSGRMMSQIMPHFDKIKAVKEIYSRSLANAKNLADKFNANSFDLIQINEALDNYNIIIACSNSDGDILSNTSMFNPQEQYLIVDVSVPKVVSDEIINLPNVEFYSVDDLALCVESGYSKRSEAATKASGIINAKLEEYHLWLHKKSVASLVTSLKKKFEVTRLETLDIAEKKLQNGENAIDVLKYLSLAMTNKLLHNPMVNLCSSQQNYTQDELIEYTIKLFDLNLGGK